MKIGMKQVFLTTITMAMLVGAAGPALADGKDKGWNNGKNGKGNVPTWNSKNANNWNTPGPKGNGANSNPGKSNHDNLQIVLNFKDMNSADVQWALKYIASLSGKKVFEGFEDGTFRPNQNVTRIEAITAAVRLMGLRDQAESAEEMNTQLNFKDASKLKEKYAWSVGYVALALENDLFAENETSVQPEKPADRLWATTLLVKALKLDAEAKAKMNTKLSFRDADQIPAGSVGYVAVAVERGLVDGFEDNTFRPNVPVTRAQLAALLDRTGDQLPGEEQNIVTGTVVATTYNNVLTLNRGGTVTTITIDPNAFVYRDGVRVGLNTLQAGDVVRVKLMNGTGIYVEVTTKTTSPNNNYTLTGAFYSYEMDTNEKLTKLYLNLAAKDTDQPIVQMLEVDPGYKIENGDRLSLLSGRSLTLTIENNKVKNIKVNW